MNGNSRMMFFSRASEGTITVIESMDQKLMIPGIEHRIERLKQEGEYNYTALCLNLGSAHVVLHGN